MCMLLVTSLKSSTSTYIRVVSRLAVKPPKKIGDDANQSVTKSPKRKAVAAKGDDASPDFNEAQAKEFSMQLEKLMSGSTVAEDPRRSSTFQMNSAVNKQKKQAYDNLNELKTLAEKMQWPVTTKETNGYSGGGMFKDYKATAVADFDNNSDVMDLASTLMNDVQQQAANAGETDIELETAWDPSSVSSYGSLAKDARERLLKSLLEGQPASTEPPCPLCGVPASEDDLAYFGKCSFCRQSELTETAPASESPPYAASRYSARDVSHGAARVTAPYLPGEEYGEGAAPAGKEAVVSVVDTKADMNAKQPRVKQPTTVVVPPPPTPVAASVWPEVNSARFRDADVDGHNTEELYAMISELATEVKRLRVEVDRLYDHDVGSRVDQVISLVEDLEQSVEKGSAEMQTTVENIVEEYLTKKKRG